MRVGILVNPDAGLGGKLGLKGSDGKATEAREAGAEDKGWSTNEELFELPSRKCNCQIEFIAAPGRMGGDWIIRIRLIR